MNNDENNPGKQSPAETELEARIVAWVSGEASAFEAAELERLVREKPELAIFKRRIEAVRGLVADAVSAEKEPVRISPERRARLLLAIGAPEAPAATAQSAAPAVPSLAVAIQRHRTQRRWMLAVAACLVCGLFLSMMIPSFQRVGPMARQVEVGLPVAMPEYAEDRALERKEKVAEEKKRDHAVLNNARALAAAPMNQGEPEAVQLPVNVDSVELSQPQVAGAPTTQFSAGSELAGKLAADSEKGSPIVLSPFEVHGTQDKGSYRANSTLAGTRVRVPAADVAAPKFSFNDQLLKDVGATNSEITLGYVPSVTAPVPAPSSANAAPGAVATDGAASELSNVSDSISVVTAQALQDTVATDSKGIAGTGAINEAGAGGAIDAAKETGASVVDGSAPSGGRIAAFGGVKISSLAKQEVAGQQQAAGAVAVAGAYDEPILLSPFTVDASLGNARAKPIQMGGGALAAPGAKGPSADNADAETSASKEPVSTFSLHVSDVSFRLAQTALARGEVPDPSRIRPEEFYNAFDYGDPAPAMSEKVSCRIEQAADPVRQQRNLVRIAMRVPATGHGAGQPLRLTVLLDTSGSMEREDRAAAVHRAMEVLTSLLGPSDRLTLIGFSRQPRLLAEQLPGDKAAQLLDIIARTPAEGGTNLEEALKLGGELARRQFAPAAQNRIVLLTDGAANLGNADPAQLAASIVTLRQQGISFDACGVGIDGINDEILEALTRKGAGRYYVVDTPESADAGFARQLAGAFRPAAENVKVQVRFNPSRVGNYRLIGFEQHRLNEEDFRNDKVEAAALAAGEAAVALYEVEALPQGEGELGEVYVRFRDTATGSMVERSWTMPYDPNAPAFDRATPTMQLAGTAALLAEKLRGGATGDAIRLDRLAPVVNALRSRYAHEARVQGLVAMFEQMRRLEKE